MPNVTTYARDARTFPLSEARIPASNIRAITLASDAADNADTIELDTINVPGKIIGGGLRVGGTLGASCTVKLQHYDGSTATDLTAASTAGSASDKAFAPAFPVTVVAGDKLRLLVGGADIAASAVVTYYVLFVRD